MADYSDRMRKREITMKIEVVGPGCPRCKKVAGLVEQVVKELGVAAEVVKVSDIKEIADRGIIFTPGIIIDGKVKSSGKVPRAEEIKSWLGK